MFGKPKPLKPALLKAHRTAKRELNLMQGIQRCRETLREVKVTYIIDVAAILCWAFRVNAEEICQKEF